MKFKGIAIAAAVMLAAAGTFRSPKAEMPSVTYSYSSVDVTLEDGKTASGRVTSWKEYNDSGRLEVTLRDGTTTLVEADEVSLVPVIE